MDWYYYNEKGEKIGAFSVTQIRELVKQGVIKWGTVIENANGRQALAGTMKGLDFPQEPVSVALIPVPPVQQLDNLYAIAHETATYDTTPKPQPISSLLCPHCDNGILQDAIFCTNCGKRTDGMPSNNADTTYRPRATQQVHSQTGGGKAIASLVCGIISLITWGGLFILPIIGIILGILGLKSKRSSGIATAGVCINAVAFVGLLGLVLLNGLLLSTVKKARDEVKMQPAQSAQEKEKERNLEAKAIYVAEELVRSLLNHPSTAKFRLLSVHSEDKGDTKDYIVKGKVTAKNSFGLELNHEYYFKFVYVKATDDFKYVAHEINER